MGSNAYKKRHKEQGLCVDCSKPAVLGEKKCAIHHYNNKIRCKENFHKNHKVRMIKSRLEKQKRRDEGRCTKCGKPLDLETDRGHIQCINCRIDIHAPRGGYHEITDKSVN